MTHIIMTNKKNLLNSFYLSVTCMMECSQSHFNINDHIQRGQDNEYDMITIKFYELKL